MVSKLKRIYDITKESISNIRGNYRLLYIIENADWVIRHVGLGIVSNLSQINAMVATRSYGARNAIVHFGSINTFFRRGKMRLPHQSNLVIVTWFHFEPDDTRIRLIHQALPFVDLWHTSCAITERQMRRVQIPEEKIRVIPLGVDLKTFGPPTPSEKKRIREKLGVPERSFVIGSFQKDGIGWGDGIEPKWIKGPDIFCDVVEALSKKRDIFILLTGPARGYVKRRLNQAKIPYHHRYAGNLEEVAEVYKALDVYLITSRIEGGPQSILESMASGVPLISTCVGMSPDVIVHGENGILVDVEDRQSLIDHVTRLMESPEESKNLAGNALRTVEHYSWDLIAERCRRELYDPLLHRP
jgi:glycosyltransferase involved in cell wall biosynthesis